jgi:hypothetical protein
MPYPYYKKGDEDAHDYSVVSESSVLNDKRIIYKIIAPGG